MTPGDTVTKDPDSTEPFGFNWTTYLAELGDDVAIDSSQFLISGGDGQLEVDNESVLDDNLRTQAYFSGGTAGKKYRVTNRITTNSTPPVTDDRSFFVWVRQQ